MNSVLVALHNEPNCWVKLPQRGWHKQAADTCLSTSRIVFASFFIFPSEKENKHPRLHHRTDKDNIKGGSTALAIAGIIAGYSRPVKVTGFGIGTIFPSSFAQKQVQQQLQVRWILTIKYSQPEPMS